MNKKIIYISFIIGVINSHIYANTLNKKYLTEERFFPKTTFKGSLFLTFGAMKSNQLSESFHMTYENKIRLNTSFKGEDKLVTTFESGNAINSPLNFDLQSKKGNNLKISEIYYSFPFKNQFKVIFGPKMYGYNGLAGKSTAYNERFAILDGTNFTTSAGVGPGLGISMKGTQGINTSIKIASNKREIKNESLHLISQIGLTKKRFGGTITSNNNDKFNAYGLSLFFQPNKLPSISAAIENKKGTYIKSTNNWIIGLQKSFNNKTYGIALGTHNELENIGYEFWSEVKLTSQLKIIPIIFKREYNIKDKNELGFGINAKFNY